MCVCVCVCVCVCMHIRVYAYSFINCMNPYLCHLLPLSVSQEVFTSVLYSLTALYIVSMTIFGGITAVLCWKEDTHFETER